MINVSNSGSTDLYDFSSFALIVNYYQNISGVAVHSLSLYSYSGSIGPHQWTSKNGMIFPSSFGELDVGLPYPPYHGMPVVVQVTTDYGPSAEWSGVS